MKNDGKWLLLSSSHPFKFYLMNEVIPSDINGLKIAFLDENTTSVSIRRIK